MLKKYNRKFIHNMPRLVFPIKPPTTIIDVEKTKTREKAKPEVVVSKPPKKTKNTKEVLVPEVQPVENIE